jgi:hypothetical protein
MAQSFPELKDLFLRTKDAVQDFMAILQPKIDNAKDDHERLYFHHIYEEEDQRLDRLNELLPKLDYFLDHEEGQDLTNFHFVRVLQDISLEKFGLHNFLEHLDLALFHFENTEYEEKIRELRGMTADDYQAIKQMLEALNERFDGAANRAGSTPTDEKEDADDNLKIDMYTNPSSKNASAATQNAAPEPVTFKPEKRLTVGSLKAKGGF